MLGFALPARAYNAQSQMRRYRILHYVHRVYYIAPYFYSFLAVFTSTRAVGAYRFKRHLPCGI